MIQTFEEFLKEDIRVIDDVISLLKKGLPKTASVISPSKNKFIISQEVDPDDYEKGDPSIRYPEDKSVIETNIELLSGGRFKFSSEYISPRVKRTLREGTPRLALLIDLLKEIYR